MSNFVLSILLIPLIFILFGLCLIIASLKEVQRSHQAKYWRETTATILDVKWKQYDVGKPSQYPQIRDRKLYQMIVSYQYTIDGKQYRSRQLFWGDTGVTNSSNAIEQRRLKYQSSCQFIAYYNPCKPLESALERELHKHTYTIVMIGSVALLIGLLSGAVILPSSLKTCGITLTSTHVNQNTPPWCDRAMRGLIFW